LTTLAEVKVKGYDVFIIQASLTIVIYNHEYVYITFHRMLTVSVLFVITKTSRACTIKLFTAVML